MAFFHILKSIIPKLIMGKLQLGIDKLYSQKYKPTKIGKGQVTSLVNCHGVHGVHAAHALDFCACANSCQLQKPNPFLPYLTGTEWV